MKFEGLETDINVRLASAIGYDCDDICALRDIGGLLEIRVWHNGLWKDFDYKDWNVIGPIAARYDCFPMRGLTDAFWHSCCVTGEGSVNVCADTPQKAVALAVINGGKDLK